jgi:hypothetical protein
VVVVVLIVCESVQLLSVTDSGGCCINCL